MAKRRIPTRGDTIRGLRNRAGLTQEELVEKAGVKLRTIQNMENGVGAEAFYIDCVAEALGLERSDLFQPLERNATQPFEPLPGVALTEANQATYGIKTVGSEWHARFAGTEETPEAVKQLFSGVAAMLDRLPPELIEFRYMRPTASLDIGVKLPIEHLHKLVQKLIAGELDRIELEPPGIALIDRILIPAQTLVDDPSSTLKVAIFRIALRSELEKLAKDPGAGATIVTLKADGSAVVDRNFVRRFVEQYGPKTEGLDSPSELGGYFTVESPLPGSRPDEVYQSLFGTNAPPTKKHSRGLSPPKSDPWSKLRRSTKLRILVADTNPRAAKLLATNLKKMGHEVQTATDGLEAVQAAADFHPQIVLLSVDLPRMDGYQTMKRIRSETSKERTLFIAMTTRSQERQRQEALGYGFDRCLITPVKPAAFEQLVELLSD